MVLRMSTNELINPTEAASSAVFGRIFSRMKPWLNGRNLLLLVAILIVSPLLAYNLQGWVRLLVFPGEANSGEGMLVAEAMRLARGENIYGPIDRPPYWVVTYPPLFQLLVAPLSHTGLWWPRVISLLGSIGQITIFLLLGRRLTGNWLVGVLASALWINSPCVNAWAVIGRTDTLGRFFCSACLASAVLVKSNRRALWLAVLFGVLGMLVKQNMIAGGIVAFFVLAVRRVRLGFIFGVAWVGITLLIYGLLQWATQGYFLKHILGYTSRPLDLLTARNWFVDFFMGIHWPYITAAVPGILVTIFYKRDANWLLVAILAGVPNAIMSGNSGADRNYFFDLLWPFCLFTPLGLWYFGGILRRQAVGPAAVVISLLVFTLLTRATWEGFVFFKMPYPTKQQRKKARKVIGYLKKVPGPILAENAGFGLLAGSEPDFAPFIMPLVQSRGMWDDSPVRKNIQNHKYTAIMMTKYFQGRYTSGMIGDIIANYQMAEVIPQNYLIEEHLDYVIWRPKADIESTGTLTSQ